MGIQVIISETKHEVDRLCSTHGGHEKDIQNFNLRTCRERDHSEDLGVDGAIILEWILEK